MFKKGDRVICIENSTYTHVNVHKGIVYDVLCDSTRATIYVNALNNKINIQNLFDINLFKSAEAELFHQQLEELCSK